MRGQDGAQDQADQEGDKAGQQQEGGVEHRVLLHVGKGDARDQVVVTQHAHKAQEIFVQVVHLHGDKVHAAGRQFLRVGRRQGRAHELCHLPVGEKSTPNCMPFWRDISES